MHILIVHPQDAVREMLNWQLSESVQDDRLSIEEARTEIDALRKIRTADNSYAVLITSLDLPPDRKSASDTTQRGLRLVEALAATTSGKAECFVMSPAGVHLGFSLQTRDMSCSFFEDGPEVFEKIVNATKDALSGRKRQPRLSVRFVQEKRSRNWHYWLEGGPESPGLLDEGEFPMPRPQMHSLAKRSARVGTMREWLKELVRIGEELRQLIFQNDDRFRTAFRMAVRNAGGIERTRFSFDVEQKMFSLAVEALVGPKPEVKDFDSPDSYSRSKRAKNATPKNKAGRCNQRTALDDPYAELDAERVPFWMLMAPIYRSLTVTPPQFSSGQTRPPLFEDRTKPINCLIIESDVGGEVQIPGNGAPEKLAELGYIDEECNRLQGQLIELKKQAKSEIAEIKRINLASVPLNQSFKRHLEDTLREREWHLVHYVGHSLYVPPKDRPAGRGLLFLPAPGGRIELLNAGLFANWLGYTQLLFLSGCQTSEENFVFEMATNYVPAVLGYRWRVDDRLATDFAVRFYEGLFRSRSIEQAFLDARKSVRIAHGVKEQIWAAPMLVLLDSCRARPAAA